jgi:hypothetical protein
MEWLDTMGAWLSDLNNQGTVSLMGWSLICFGFVLFALAFWHRRRVVIRGNRGGVAVGG